MCASLKVPRLADVISAEGVLDTLVDPRQPSWFLYGALRALALFTSREFKIPFLAYVFNSYTDTVAHSGKELYKRFLSIPGTNPNPSQGGDLDVEFDPDIEIVQEDAKLPHLECLCLHLGDHTRDSDEVRHVSTLITAISHICTCRIYRPSAQGTESLRSSPHSRLPTKKRERSCSLRTRS